ncbi:organic solute transporter ostalpha protein [Actinidia rufa]|uniref:Organic solute transporter ostalpha protein n=1 Tax=Actinidia rufa TaxID=165716 RepID=A0A7J0ESN0_9ERIC|nr:organic solute transporter ostalpha protein [Actinidia rufa]
MAPIYYILVALPCTVGAIALALLHIYRHLLNYTEPTYQRYIVRIIFMVPIDSAEPNIAQFGAACNLLVVQVHESSLVKSETVRLAYCKLVNMKAPISMLPKRKKGVKVEKLES